MNYLEYGLFSGGFVNRFLTAGVFLKDSPFQKTAFEGRVNEWLIKGSSIHDNPYRAKVIQGRMGNIPPFMEFGGLLDGDEVESFGQEKKLKVYFPFGNAGIADSGFYENPKYLRSYGYTLLDVPQEETAEAEVSTCGAVTVWLNGELVTDFTPFTRNEEKHTRVSMHLKKGINELTVCLEDLAERDTDYHYRLRYLGKQELRIRIPVREDVDTDAVKAAEHALSAMYFEKEAYLSEPVCLNLESFAEEPVQMVLTPDRFTGPKHYQILPGQKQMYLFHADDVPSSFYFFRVEVAVSGLVIGKVIGTYSFNTQFMAYHEDTYEERKQRIRAIIRDTDEGSDYRAVIRLHDGEVPDNLEKILSNHMAWVNERRDCSDFRLIIMVYMYVRFSHLFSDKLKRDVEDAMAGYRYWCDEPGDDVMWFFSENHALMFHISQYFAGQSMPERIFTCSGLTGREACKKAERLLNAWFESFFTDFATEWNSSTYLPIDVMGLGYLYDLTPKGSPLHEKSKKALDMLAFSLAVNEHRGNIMPSFGRTYERELKGSYSTGMPSLLYLFYNAGYMNDHFRALVPIVVEDYEPPAEYARYVGLKGDEELIHQNTQGIDRYVNLYLYKNSRALLSTAVGFRPFGPGYQESIVQATLDGTAQVFVNHPGEAEIYGNGRPGFWAGNGCLPFAAQYRNISILEYRIGAENLLDYTHAYAPLSEFDSYKIGSSAAAFEKNGGFIGIRALNGLKMQTEGACRRREFISPGRNNVWVLKVGTFGEYRDADELLRDMEQMEIVMGDGKTVVVTGNGDRYETEKNVLYVNGKKVHDYPQSVAGKLELNGGK